MTRHAKAPFAGSNSATHLGRAGGALLTLLLTLLLTPTFAAAAQHQFLETFGSAAEPEFGMPINPVVDQASGDLYVIDSMAGTVSRFNPDGTAASFSALGTNVIDGEGPGDQTPNPEGLSFGSTAEAEIAIDNSGGETEGNLYVTNAVGHAIYIFDSATGNYLGELNATTEGPMGESCGVAVGPTGSVFVGEYPSTIHKYEPSGAVPANTDNTLNFAATESCVLAAGAGPSAGFVFVDSLGGKITKFDATTGEEKYEVVAAPNATLSVDPASGHVFAVKGGVGEDAIEELDASGPIEATLVDTILLPREGQGVAIDGSSGKVYTTRLNSTKVEVFEALFEVAVNGTGNGTGTVQCKFGAGSFEACVGAHLSGTEVTVKATADTGSELTAFSGTGSASACVASPCTFTLQAESSVTAGFNLEPGVVAVTSLSPNKGPVAGGNTVEISGTNLQGAESVKFGTAAATITEDTETLIKATAPAGAAGTVDVRVKTPTGESLSTAADDYTYIPPAPGVSTVSPSKGPAAGGNTVTITGTNLANAESVKFGTAAATITEDTATQIKVTAPSCTPGTVDVTVTTSGGSSAISAADEYTCVAVPTVSAVSPSKGPAAGGNTVTITGTNLGEAESVKFGTAAATITEDTATQIKVTVPSCLAGALHVTVTTSGGTSATSAADEYTCVAAPSVSSIAPAKGPAEGGNAVEISGVNLSATTKVEFGTTVVNPPFLSNSGTKLKVKAPAHAAGAVDIKVTTAGGTSTVIPADEYTFFAKPAITGVSPSSGTTAGGNQVTIAGSGFSGAESVKFGSAGATFAVESDTAIKATVPAGAAGAVDVHITGPGGESANTAADDYTYIAPAPVIAPPAAIPPPSALPAPQCLVPKLKGKALGQAKAALKAANCVLGKASKPKKAKGKLVVKSSSPAAGKSLPAGGKVDLKLAPAPAKKKGGK